MKKLNIKKTLSMLLVIIMVVGLFSICTTTASAASYPSSMATNFYLTGYVGDQILLTFNHYPEYKNEKVEIKIYNPNGDLCGTSDFNISNYDGSTIRHLTVTWDTTGEMAGKYKVEVTNHFYSLYRWNTAPNPHTSYVVLKKPTDKKAVNNTFKGSKTHYSVPQSGTIAATKKGINNSYNAWNTLYVKNVDNPFNIQLTDIYLASEAEEMAIDENMFNLSKHSQCQWVLMKFNVKNRGKSEIKFGDLVDWTSAYLSNGDNATVLDTCTFGDLPNYNTKIAPGETKEVWLGYYILKKQGIPFIKLDNGAFINPNPLCAKEHKYSNSSDKTCNKCNATRNNNSTVASKTESPASYKLSKTSYTYDGKVKTPSVVVKNKAGKTLKKGTDYTVTYASGRKNVGTYKVTIKMKGKYTGTKTLTFKINPAKTTVSKVTGGAKKLTVSITKKTAQTTGYEVQYSTSSKFTTKTTKTKTITKNTTTKTTITKLTAKKTYYVRVRTYKTVNGKKYYSAWSAAKKAKTK